MALIGEGAQEPQPQSSAAQNDENFVSIAPYIPKFHKI